MNAQRLFDGEHLRADLFNPDAKRLFVSLRQRIAEPGAFDTAKPVQKFVRAGYAHLHLQSRLNDWFVNDETEALEQVLTGVGAGYADTCAFGFSMGGYGALRFARALMLRRVVLISAQVSIDPGVVPWDRRYRDCAGGFDRALGDLAQHGHAGLGGVILFDPFRPLDRRNAAMITALHPGLRQCRLPAGGHPATRVLREGGNFAALQEALRDDALSLPSILRLHKDARRDSPIYWRHLAAQAAKRGHKPLERQANARLATLQG